MRIVIAEMMKPQVLDRDRTVYKDLLVNVLL
jgi:hypothetical protein